MRAECAVGPAMRDSVHLRRVNKRARPLAGAAYSDHARRWRRPQALAPVDDVALRVLIGEPGLGPPLVDARLAVVAHAGREGLVEALPLDLAEVHRVVVLA